MEIVAESQMDSLEDLNIFEIERDFRQRKFTLDDTCKRYGNKLRLPLKLYNKKLRFDIKHRLMYCENYKIGSSTWAIHLLKMNKIPIYHRTPIHIVTRKNFPPLFGAKKKRFLDKATSLIVARDPFERLLSSFKDKLGVRHKPNFVTWATFGQVQRVIRREYREKERNGTVPTFREFVKYLVGELSPNPLRMRAITKRINEHWKPVYLNCGPCTENFTTIIKMETFSRDSLYLKQKLKLDIDVEFVRKGGREGHTTVDRTVEAFKTVGPELIRRLHTIYQIDFEMFGYSAIKYLDITEFNID